MLTSALCLPLCSGIDFEAYPPGKTKSGPKVSRLDVVRRFHASQVRGEQLLAQLAQTLNGRAVPFSEFMASFSTDIMQRSVLQRTNFRGLLEIGDVKVPVCHCVVRICDTRQLWSFVKTSEVRLPTPKKVFVTQGRAFLALLVPMTQA
jgi:hypothetical protein